MKVTHNPAAVRWRGIPVNAKDFSVELQQSTSVIDAVTEFYNKQDVVVKRVTGAGSLTSYDLQVMQNLALGPVEITNLTPEVMQLVGARVTGTQYSTTGRLRVRGYAGTREYTLRFPDQVPVVQEYDHDFIPGTLAAHCVNNVLARVAGKTPGGASQNVFTDAVHGFTLSTLYCAGYNPNSIVAGLELACVQFASSRNQFVGNDPSEHRFPSLLVGPRHVIGAHHAMNLLGQSMFWRRNDGSFAEAVVLDRRDLGVDLGLTLLDRDVTGIQYARVLPQDWTNKLKAPVASLQPGPGGSLTLVSRTPSFLGIGLTGNTSPGLGFVRHAQVFGFSQIGYTSVGEFFRACGFREPYQEALKPWYSLPYGGDSNSPVFLLIDQGGTQTPVFVCSLYTAGSGPSYGAHVTLINQNLNEMAAAAGDNRPFSLLTADLSAFPDV